MSVKSFATRQSCSWTSCNTVLPHNSQEWPRILLCTWSAHPQDLFYLTILWGQLSLADQMTKTFKLAESNQTLGGSCSDEMFPHDCQQLPKCGFLTLLYAGRYHLCMSQPPWCFQAACVPPTKSNQCTLVKSNLNIYMSSPNLRSCNSRLGILRHATYRVTSKLWLSYLAFLDLYKQALATEFYLSNRSSPHSPS